MVVLGDEAQLKARFGRFGHSGNIDARRVHGLRQTFHRLGNYFGRTRWNCYMTRLKWNFASVRLVTVLVSIRLEIVLILMQDQCTVCLECTIGSEFVLDAPDGSPR